ncbi:MAG: flagellar basal body L-ring protein FlgH [bacterium]
MIRIKENKVFLLVFVLVLFWGELCLAQHFEKYNQNSLYTDIKAHSVGDIVTILIIESTSGAQQSGVNSSDQASLSTSGGVTGNLTSFLPLFGASSKFESDHSGKAGTAQKDVLTGKITAVVTEIKPNGNLKLQGKRRLEVNGETYILTVKGMVRQKDIASENLVYSYNLANVEISYKKAGFINKLGKPGLIARWSTWLMVLGLGAAAYFGVSAAK